jgi:hypothetical protein
VSGYALNYDLNFTIALSTFPAQHLLCQTKACMREYFFTGMPKHWFDKHCNGLTDDGTIAIPLGGIAALCCRAPQRRFQKGYLCHMPISCHRQFLGKADKAILFLRYVNQMIGTVRDRR